MDQDKLIIQQLMKDLVTAITSKNTDKIMAFYAPDVRAFDAVQQLQFKGVDAYKKHWQMCMDHCPGPTTFDVSQMDIMTSGDLAVCSFLAHCGGTNDKGEQQAGWMRGTICFHQRQGQWKIVHEHYSAPFDMETGQPLFDLQP